jgi:tetratricopeptide (TPR) repeat protein
MDSVVLVLPFARPDGSEFDRWLGESFARTFSHRLEASGRRVVPIDSATRLCRSLGICASDEGVSDGDLDLLVAQTGATHVLGGEFDRAGGELTLKLSVQTVENEPEIVSAVGPDGDFQEVIDDAIVRAIQHISGAKGEHVRGALRSARTTESLDAYLAVVRARSAWAEGDVEGFEDEVSAAIRLDPFYVDPHQVVAIAARALGDASREVLALREVADVHGQAKRHHAQATALLFVGHALVEQGDWDEGKDAYEEAAGLFEMDDELRGAVQAQMNIANVLLRQGDHEQAIEEYTVGMRRVQDYPSDRAKYAFNLGLALKETGDLEGAAARLEEARQLGVELRDDELIASCYNALGTVFDDQDDLDRALSHFRRAEEHLDAEADPVLLAGVKDHIGIVLKKQGKREQALDYSGQACQLFESRGDPLHVAIAYVNRAGLLLELDRPEDATPFVAAAHREFVRLGSPAAERTLVMLEDLGFDDDAVRDIEEEVDELDELDESEFEDEDLDEDV